MLNKELRQRRSRCNFWSEWKWFLAMKTRIDKSQEDKLDIYFFDNLDERTYIEKAILQNIMSPKEQQHLFLHFTSYQYFANRPLTISTLLILFYMEVVVDLMKFRSFHPRWQLWYWTACLNCMPSVVFLASISYEPKSVWTHSNRRNSFPCQK